VGVRFYFPSSGSANNAQVQPPIGSLWQSSGSIARYRLGVEPAGTSEAGRTLAETLPGPAYAGAYQFVSDPLAAGMWLESFRLLVMTANSSSVGSTVSLAARVALVNNAGTAVRGELYAGRSTAVAGPGITAHVAHEIAANVAQVATSDGDRLVVELGLYVDNAVSTSAGGNIRVGDNLADYDIPTAGATGGRPFFEGEFGGVPYVAGAVGVESASSGTTRRVGAALAETLYEGDLRVVGAATVETLYEGDLRIMGAVMTEALVLPRRPALTASGAQLHVKMPDGRWEPVWLT